MNIVLIGLRGSGKTTVGKILAQKLGREFMEMDELITHKAGLTITEIVEKYGWDKFRDIEEEVTGEIAKIDNIINASGGGIITREKNIIKLKKKGVLVWLQASIDTLVERIGKDTERPPLVKGRTVQEDMEITLKERKRRYQQAADLTINTEDKTPEEVAEDIINLLAIRGAPVIDADTRICCLIGDPVAHSLSPLIHNAGYKVLGINYAYFPFRVSNIKQAIEGIRDLGIRGASITIPHKTKAMKHLDKIDPLAQKIGAVNTIVNDDGVLTGYNTDGEGAIKALEEVTALKGKSVVMVGAGGAALAIAWGLKGKGARLVILNRTGAKAKKLAEKVNAEGYGNLKRLSEIASADILINATSVGMWPEVNQSIIPKDLLRNRLTVFDIVYNPKETRLIAEARERGCAVVHGYRMLLYQAAKQFELFTGLKGPIKAMESALAQALEGGKNAAHSDRW
jgi:shikimate dehydrogenase